MKPSELSHRRISDFSGIALQRCSFHPGERIFEERNPGDSVLFIEQGSVQVGMSNQTIAILLAGSFFGEHCLEYPGYRVNSATALEDTVVCRIERDDMLEALRIIPTLREAFLVDLIDQQEKILYLLLELEWSRRASQVLME
jgi:CRP-like cAMP-binding protein